MKQLIYKAKTLIDGFKLGKEFIGKNYVAVPQKKAELGCIVTYGNLMMTVKDKKFPQTLDELEPYFNDKEIFSWLLKNVEYLGLDLERDKVDISKTPIAYDKTLLKKGEGTNVLFVNGLVEFCRPEELGELGINDSEDAQVE